MRIGAFFKSLYSKWKAFLEKDRYVTANKRKDEFRLRRGIALITSAGFAVMSVLNVIERSYLMLASTLLGSAAFLAGWWLSKYKSKEKPLLVIFVATFIIVFTVYTFAGGNSGFAALWIVLATYVVMLAVNFRIGLSISLYYLVMLILFFEGPLHPLLMYDYNETFLLRFPALYAINMIISIYLTIRYRSMEYEFILQHEELERVSRIDLSTGLLNRNCYQNYEHKGVSKTATGLCAVFIDINGLHEYNNLHGHDAGDKMLREIAELSKEHFPEAQIFRLGGDEYLICQEDNDEKKAAHKMECIRADAAKLGYTISCGLAAGEKAPYDIAAIVKEADERMRADKAEYYRHHERRKQR